MVIYQFQYLILTYYGPCNVAEVCFDKKKDQINRHSITVLISSNLFDRFSVNDTVDSIQHIVCG